MVVKIRVALVQGRSQVFCGPLELDSQRQVDAQVTIPQVNGDFGSHTSLIKHKVAPTGNHGWRNSFDKPTSSLNNLFYHPLVDLCLLDTPPVALVDATAFLSTTS